MISVDTNILARYLIKDDELQYNQVVIFLLGIEQRNEQAFISIMVLLELNWVLTYRYNIERAIIIDKFLQLLETVVFEIEHAEIVYQTLIFAKNNTFDLSDLLIGCYAKSQNHLPVVTFDKKASKIDSFIALAQLL